MTQDEWRAVLATAKTMTSAQRAGLSPETWAKEQERKQLDMETLLKTSAEQHGLTLKGYTVYPGPHQPQASIDGKQGPTFNPYTIEAKLRRMGIGTNTDVFWYQAPYQPSIEAYFAWVKSWIDQN